MPREINFPAIAIINDLDTLITEIDTNPQLSSWVIRLVLKAIKDKAKKMVQETSSQTASLDEPTILEAFLNSSPLNASQVKALRPE